VHGRPDVQPWVPELREEDAANVGLFAAADGQQIVRVALAKIPVEPLAFRFAETSDSRLPNELRSSSSSGALIRYLGQETAADGGVLLELAFLQAVEGDRHLRRRCAVKVTLPSPIVCATFADSANVNSGGKGGNGNNVILACADGSLLNVDFSLAGITSSRRFAGFNPVWLSPHPTGAVFMAGDADRGVIKCLDAGLNVIKWQFGHEDRSGSAALDVARFFRPPAPPVSDITFAPPPSSQRGGEDNPTAEIRAAVLFSGGPLAMLKINSGVFSDGDMDFDHLTADYLRARLYKPLLLCLSQLDWNHHSQMLLRCLSSAFNKMYREAQNSTLEEEEREEMESLLEMCLGLYYSPNKPIDEEVRLNKRV